MALTIPLWTSSPALHAICLGLAVIVCSFIVNLYRARRNFIKLRKEGLAMPPHHPIFGHILLVAKIIRKLPKDAHGHYLADQIRRQYPYLDSLFYLDTWPFCPPVLVVVSPHVMSQFTQEKSVLQKHKGLRQFLRPLTGKHDLVSMEGQLWKTWRIIFNPGFNANHLATMVPRMLEDVCVFRDILRKHAKQGDIFSLEEATLNVTLDIIGKVTLLVLKLKSREDELLIYHQRDARFNTQLSYNDMTTAMREQIKWCTFGFELNPLIHVNPLRPLIQWYNTRRMNVYINRELKSRYSTHRDDLLGKTIVDLALKAYWEENKSEKKMKQMDATFQEFAVSQIKLFIFTGHDTTASSLCYVYHLLSRHPAALTRLRAEYNTVFGPNLSETSSLIASKPHLLNQLPYTLAIIKETLRLFPAITVTRAGRSDFFLTDSEGRQYPTQDCLVWGNHHGLHRNPCWWPHPDEFLPERWLVEPNHPLYPVENAWRPFERGPRNCIGQELAIIEIKMILALTVRELDVSGAYADWDKSYRRGKTNVNSVDGERAYQIHLGAAHPSDGFPCKVTLVKPNGCTGN